MEDEKILELYLNRSEEAIKETEAKYGNYMRSIAFRILADEQSSMECVNDALLAAWNTIPPEKPCMLQTYLGKIVRNISIDRFRHENSKKRGAGQMHEVLEELGDLSDGGRESQQIVDHLVFTDLFKRFIYGLKETDRMVFLKRYWYFMSISEIADEMHLKENNIHVILHRCRRRLNKILKEEGFEI